MAIAQRESQVVSKKKTLQYLEKMCDEGLSGGCITLAKEYKSDEVKKLAYLEKGCNNGKYDIGRAFYARTIKDIWGRYYDEDDDYYIGTSCLKAADIYAKKLEGDKALPYYAKACEHGKCSYDFKKLDESLYLASQDLYNKHRKEAREKMAELNNLNQTNNKERLAQICANDDETCKCKNGDGEACASLGSAYEKKLDGKQAKDYYQKGCEYNSYDACNNLYKIEKDKEKSIATFKKICDSGISEGCDLLGKIYKENKDYKQAIAYYAKGCEVNRKPDCRIDEIYKVAWDTHRDLTSEAYWLGYHKGDSKKAKQSVKEIKQIRNEILGELLKYRPKLCKTKGVACSFSD